MTDNSSQQDPIKIDTEIPGLKLIQMLTINDDEAYFELQNQNTEFWKKYGNTIDSSLEAVTKRRSRAGNVRFGIYLEGRLIGMTGYTQSEDGTQAELGILMSESDTGHGYATSAFKALSEFVADRFDRVYAEADPSNEKSIKLCQRAGYVLQPGMVKRNWGDSVVLDYVSQKSTQI